MNTLYKAHGDTIKKYRILKNLTTIKLALKLGCSQSKISKLENGVMAIKLSELELIKEVLSIPQKNIDVIRKDIETRNFSDEFKKLGFSGIQEEISKLEQTICTIRSFQNVFIPGLLQTEEYMATLFSNLSENIDRPFEHKIQSRLSRQNVLKDVSKMFFFILDEAVFHCLYRLCDKQVLEKQVEHVKKCIDCSNIFLFVLPFHKKVPALYSEGFDIYDDKLVIVENKVDAIYYYEKEKINKYTNDFNILLKCAITRQELKEYLINLIPNL